MTRKCISLKSDPSAYLKLNAAVKDVFAGNETFSTAARKYCLYKSTVMKHVIKTLELNKKSKGVKTDIKKKPISPISLSQIFTKEQETELANFLNRYTYLPYDTSNNFKAARQLIYQFVKERKIKYPPSWDIAETVGIFFFKGFMRRHPEANIKNANAGVKSRARIRNSNENKDPSKNIVEESVKEFIPMVKIAKVKTKTNVPIAVSESDKTSDANPAFPNSYESIADTRNTTNDADSRNKSNVYEATNEKNQTPNVMNNQSESNTYEPNATIDMNETPLMHIEPECQIHTKDDDVPMMLDDLRVENPSPMRLNGSCVQVASNGNTSHCSSLHLVPENDDVFKSFGRNIAFHVKELYNHSQVDAFEVMNEVQILVNQRLIKLLRLKANNHRPNPLKRPQRNLRDEIVELE